MGGWVSVPCQWPLVVPLEKWRWFSGSPVHSRLLCAHCVPSTGLDAAVTIMNRASSLLTEAPNLVEGNREPVSHPPWEPSTLETGGGTSLNPHHFAALMSLPFSLRSRPYRAWDLSDRPSRQGKGKQGSGNPCAALWCCQTSFGPCIPQTPCHHPCLGHHLQRGEDWSVPIGLDILRYRDYHKWVRFPYLLTKIYITHSNVTQICPFTVITNEVTGILNKLEWNRLWWSNVGTTKL